MTDSPPGPLATPLAWNLVSSGYVSEIVPTFTLYAQDALRLANVQAGEAVVDVACGPGTLAFAAAKRGAHVHAIDFAQAMIDALRSQALAEGITTIAACVGDGMALPYANSTFDAGFSMFGLMFFPDRVLGLRELHRVLRPGGRVVIAAWQPVDTVPLIGELFAGLAEALPSMPFSPGQAPMGTAQAMHSELAQAEFSEIEIHEASHAMESPSLAAFWESTSKSLAPLVLLRHHLGTSHFDKIAEAIFQRLRRRFGDGPQSLTMRANLGLARRAPQPLP